MVHDDRGNARVEWVMAPADSDRVPLSLEDSQPVYKPEHGYDPYGKAPRALPKNDTSAQPPKRDLRRLSEWIKQVRAVEARKQRGDDDDQA